MKAKLFDKNVFLEDLRQLRGVNVVCGVILLLESFLVPLYLYINARSHSSSYAISMDLYEASILVILIAVIMPVMINNMFEFIDKRNSSDFYHSLPVRRETMYITHILAVVVSCLVLYIVPVLIEWGLLSAMSCVDLSTNYVFYEFADVFTIGLLLSAAVIVSKCVCGTRFGVMAVFVMILFLPRAYLIYIREMVEDIYPYVLLGYGHNIFLDQSWNLLFGIFDDVKSLRSIIYTLILSLIYFVIGGALFIRRKSEKAESVAISSKLQLAFRVLPALTFSMLPLTVLFELVHYDSFIDGEDLVSLFVLYVMAVVIYFLYEIITTRKLSSVIKAAPGLLVLVIGNIALFGAVEGYGAYQSGLGMDADKVESISFMAREYYYEEATGVFGASSYGYYDRFLTEIEFTDDEIIDSVVENLKATPERIDSEYNYTDVCLCIKCSTGTIYRKVYVRDMDGFLDALLNSNQMFSLADKLPGIDKYQFNNTKIFIENGTLSSNYDVDTDDFKSIYAQALEELKALDNQTVYELTTQYYSSPYLFFSIYDSEAIDTFYINISADSELMPKTYELVMDYIQSNSYDEEVYDEEIYYEEDDTGTYYYDEESGEWIYYDVEYDDWTY